MTVQSEAPDREDQARVGTAVAQSLDGRDGRRQVLTLTAILGRNRQTQDAEPRTPLDNPRARTRRAVLARRLRGRPALPERTARPRRTSVAAFPRRQIPSPRPSRMMNWLLDSACPRSIRRGQRPRTRPCVLRRAPPPGTMMAKDRPFSKTFTAWPIVGVLHATRGSPPRPIRARAAVPRLASPRVWFIMFTDRFRCDSGDKGMKCLIVYYMNGHWIGEEVSWKRSGSGSYRETSRIEIPQSKAANRGFRGREPLRDRVARQDPGRARRPPPALERRGRSATLTGRHRRRDRRCVLVFLDVDP